MPTELEDLVEFLHHGNTQIRQIACENLVGFSTAQPDLFKRHQLLPVTDLKLLARDYSPIAKNALTILINLSSDEDILKFLVKDDQFIEVLLKKLMNIKDPNVDEVAMLLANLVKSDHLEKLHSLKRKAPESVSTSENAIDQLMDCFVKGADGSLNKHANFDYLSYVFADLSQSEKGRAYFTTRQEYDGVVPITKLTVFTEHESNIRRKGVASTIKNVAFDVASHPMLFDEDGVNLLPYLLLPITGPEEFPDEESMSMLPDLQLLPPDKKRDSDMTIITTHLETLLLLTTTREGREKMRAVQVYPIIRECHLNVEDDDVRESCDRLVQVLMRDEEGEGEKTDSELSKAQAQIEAPPAEDEDEKAPNEPQRAPESTAIASLPYPPPQSRSIYRCRRGSCLVPPNPRGEWLPASDRVELPDSDVCDDGSRDSPDPVVNLPDHPSLAQQFWALMSRAPLIRSSPALGSSSYGAVRFPQDSDDDANLALQPKNTRQVSNGTTRTSYESCQGGPSSGGRSSRPKRSHSSNRRKSSELYTEGHNRRPSSATSDIGMGADSKYSFATGLAVPGNPVIQETPITSPYLTSDDEEDVLDIEDEVTKPADDDPPDNSPYAQVRATVPATDDISLSINTPRMWFLSLLFSLTGSAANLFFSLRYPSVAITPIIALVLVHPLGKFWDVLLKRTGDHLEVFENGTLHHRESLSGELETPKVPWMSRVRQWFAQGRWNEKEHACVYISSNVSFGFAFATDVIVEQHKFYQQEVPIMYQVLLIISTQVLGYAFAGLTRRFLVRPSAMIWPGTLMSTAMFTTMHKTTNKKANGWSISRYKFFIVVWGGAFLWYFVPGLLMPALSYFNVITWFAPKNVVVSNLFGVASGLGMFPLTFDWAQIAYIGSPLLTPWWAAANIVTGLVVVIWIIAPILYYKNVLFSSYMPILSAAVFDNTGHPYDVSRILTSEFLFDQKAYEEYSPVYLPITYVLSYGVQFAALTSLVTHTICWYGKDILHQTRKAFEEKREMPDLETYEPLRTENGSRPTRRSDDMSRVSSHDPTREMPLGVEDVHCRLMRRYKDAPLTWYLIVLVTMLAIATYTVEHYPVHLPWYGLFLALIITSVFFIPVGIIMAVTNQHSSLYLICQLLCGIVFPGRPVANMIFVTYSYISSAQGIKFSSDLKLGHYMKIPPRILFGVQMMATLVSSLTQIGVLNWMFAFIPGLCTPQAMNGFNCPIARVHFNGSILWGVVGPQRFFGPGGLYRPLVWAFLLGAIAPLGAWILGRRSKKNIWRMINFPILFGSLSWIPPATGLNFSIWAVVCFVFNYVIRRRKTAWWEKYAMTLSAALDSGLAFAVIVVFFACIYPGWVDGFRWWGTEIYKQGCDWIACPYKQLEPGQTFGG
ncbi:Oligopeptide transporter OPT superfamily [Penicillium atrosanguineum]|nr:Oligopeptide transporter OPT superfamily [Penicillium atrosanguineum]